MTFSIEKDPAADLDYSVDWTLWLGADTIQSSAWSVNPVPAQLGSSLVTHDAGLDVSSKIATVWLSGGAGHGAYDVTNTITTAAGRTEQRTIRVTMAAR